MKRRYTILFLSLVLALALAVPALGGPSNPIASISASVKQTATKALKKAKAAQKTANSALSAANTAQGDANKAQSTANAAQKAATAAQGTANTALSTANSAKAAADVAKAAADTAQATADTKLGETFTEFGDGSGTVAASGTDLVECPGASEVTGGGYSMGGAGANEAVPVYTASYGDAWVASLERIPGGTNTWSVQAIVTCAQ